MRIIYTNRFKKDFKRMKKRGQSGDVFEKVVEKLAMGDNLDAKHKDHELSGRLAGYRACHIKGDWLLLYRIGSDTLFLERTGTHSDLFK